MDTIYSTIKSGKILVGDGGWGTQLIANGMQAGECPEMWSIEHPDIVKSIAIAYKEAGADLISTNTFGGNRIKLKFYGLEDKAKEINKKSAYLSRTAVGDNYNVLASIGPTGKLLIMGEVSEDELYEAFREQAIALEEGGADACTIETMSDLDEARCAVQAVKENTKLEIVVSFTFMRSSDGMRFNTIMGTTPESFIDAIKQLGVSILGVNCTLSVEDMDALLQKMYEHDKKTPFLVYPNAGKPQLTDKGIIYPETPEAFARYVINYYNHGARIIGGCCGTTPEHIKAIRKEVERIQSA
ncbi:MAG TPA: homocysteine S-methyltransferase family protein [Candidatus Hydrogenedens sp.]|nr:homocysteine S-methyltransferase family protein [Candidatus Hydrogenedens sp.]